MNNVTMNAPQIHRAYERVGPYELLEVIGQGGMAEILLARQAGLQGFTRAVAIKRMLPEHSGNDRMRRMFIDEAQVTSLLAHPNLVQVFEVFEAAGVPYIVMEYLVGESLAAMLRAARKAGHYPLPAFVASHIVRSAAAGLHAAHETRAANGSPLEIVHRDISPHNLFITDAGFVKVIDFGIARGAHREEMTRTGGGLKGKLAYMSPEQAAGRKVDRRTDIFALGIILHEMLTGRRLFRRDVEFETLRAVIEEPIPRPTQIDPTIPKALDDVCMRALSRDLDARYSTAEEFRLALLKATPEAAAPADIALGNLVREILGQRLEGKRQAVAEALAGRALPASSVVPLDTASLPQLSDVDVSGIDIGSMPGKLSDESLDHLDELTGRGGRRGLLWLGAGAGLALLVGLLFALKPWKGADNTPIQSSTTELQEPPPETSERVPPAVSNAPTRTEVTPAIEERVRLQSIPSGAEVWVGVVRIGETPLEIPLPFTGEIRRDGYRTESVQIPRGAQAPQVELRRVRRSGRPRRPTVDEAPTMTTTTTTATPMFERFD